MRTASLAVVACLLVTGIWLAPSRATDPPADDFTLIAQRLRTRAFAPTIYSAENLQKLLADQRPDGSWPAIDYTDQNKVVWKTNYHLVVLQQMASAYCTPAHPLHGDAKLKQGFLAGYDYWVKNDFQHPANWWWNVVATPGAFYRILLLMQKDLSPEQIAAGIKICQRAGTGEGRNGQNLIWTAQVGIALGCLRQDAEAVRQAFQIMSNEVSVATTEGKIQADWSFCQHAYVKDGVTYPQLYSGGYGKEFARQCAYFCRLAGGTRFAWPAEKVQVLTHYVLDGQQWMTRGRIFDYSACGREIARPHLNAADLAEACDDLAALNPERRKELEAFAARLRGQAPPEVGARIGNRYFWRTEFMAHQRPKYYTSVKLASERTVGTETMNGENTRGAHLFDGVTYLFREGEEYYDIFPVWDWLRVPGITWSQAQPFWPYMPRGLSSWAGGVSDGLYGMASLDLLKDADWKSDHAELRTKLRAHKSWFYFDDEFVCLGAGITCPLEKVPVLTSVNQCRFNAKEFALSTETPRQRTDPTERQAVWTKPVILPGDSWVYHAGSGYYFPPGNVATVQGVTQHGNWKSINQGVGSADDIALDVFSLWIDHGVQPVNQSYTYVVVPDTTPDKMREYVQHLPVAVVTNSPELQAVWNRTAKVGMAALYQVGTVRLGELQCRVSQPCLLLVRPLGKQLELAISNPEATAAQIQVEVNQHLEGLDCTWSAAQGTSTITFSLPGTIDEAGKPLVKLLKILS